MSTPVSVIIPTTLQNPRIQEAITAVIHAVRLVPGSEVLIVVNGVTDPSLSVQRDPHLRLLTSSPPGAAAARNTGIQLARHDAILFTDDDCVVPPTWCRDLGETLNNPLSAVSAAVAAPVTVHTTGPITAFLDYRRIFHAPPMDAVHVRYPVTANCGLRRDLLPSGLRFDQETFAAMAGGEDAEFGYALRAHGQAIHWLAQTPPVVHVLPERIDEITARFSRYGLAGARLYYRCGRWEESVPGAVDWYRDITNNSSTDFRRFREITNPHLRLTFATYECMLVASWLIGYLEELGRLLRHNFICVDHNGLTARWRDIAEFVGRTATIPDSLPASPHGWLLHEPADTPHLIPTDRIAAALRRYAPLTDRPIPTDIWAHTRRWEHEFAEMAHRDRRSVKRIWATLRTMESPSLGAVETLARTAGIPFGEACHGLEKLLYNTVDTHLCPPPDVATGE
ncbi:MAG: glycosyltransferase [Pseudonocardiaceae bacterium]